MDVETVLKRLRVDRAMTEARLVTSPVCQLPPRAMTALEQASVDDVLEPGAFTAMGHLPAAAVLGDALDYADRLVQSVGTDDLSSAQARGILPGAGLLPADAAFLSQVIGLRDLSRSQDVTPQSGAEEGATLGELIEEASARFLERVGSWRAEPGRRSAGFRVQKGDGDVLWPGHVLPVDAQGEAPDPSGDPDAFVLFAVLPVLAPFLVLEEDCFVAPRLE